MIAPIADHWFSLVNGCMVWRCQVCKTHNEGRAFFCEKCCPADSLPPSRKPEMRLEFDVHGKPAGMGSKKAFFVKKLGRAVITDDNKPAKKNWENAVATAAAEAMAGRELITGPVWVHFIFWFARPKAHFRTGKNSHLLSDSAPAFHISKPDFDKLCRLMADAMTGVVYRDDSQICSAVLEKQWTTGSEGARVIVESEGLNVRMPGNREGVVPVKVARPAGSGGGDAEAEREQGVDLPV